MEPNEAEMAAERRYAWPKYVLAAVVLGVVLSVLAVMMEARRVKNMKVTDPMYLPGRTNAAQ